MEHILKGKYDTKLWKNENELKTLWLFCEFFCSCSCTDETAKTMSTIICQSSHVTCNKTILFHISINIFCTSPLMSCSVTFPMRHKSNYLS